ncbi:23S rRNA pseudouridine(955/2504/2580) synthase RluC [Kaarinaea lacus]
MKQSEAQVATKVQIIQIDEDRAGQRIDNFLLNRLKGVPKSRIYRLLRKGEVRVNKGRIKASYRLEAGDEVRIPPVRQGEPAKTREPGANVLSLIENSILAEEKGFLVLNKPSGIAVHGGSGLNYGVIEALRKLRPDAPYLELAHRLDRETSGILIIAKKRSVLRELHGLLRGEAGGMEKRYLALVQGQWQGGERRVDAPLLKNTLRSGERVVTVSQEGKTALSLFRPVTIYGHAGDNGASLVEVDLKTGRTHQIRVHAAFIGHPIAGDEKYGDADFNRAMKEKGLRRLFLHAQTVEFSLSGGDQDYHFVAPLYDDLKKVLTQLET